MKLADINEHILNAKELRYLSPSALVLTPIDYLRLHEEASNMSDHLNEPSVSSYARAIVFGLPVFIQCPEEPNVLYAGSRDTALALTEKRLRLDQPPTD